MNKQFGKLLEGCPGCPLYLSDSEQQVWLAAQKAMLEVGYRKPHPADGELVKCPLEDSCDAFQEQECDVCTIGQVRQAQLAHTKARMAKVSWLLEPCPHFRRRSHEGCP